MLLQREACRKHYWEAVCSPSRCVAHTAVVSVIWEGKTLVAGKEKAVWGLELCPPIE